MNALLQTKIPDGWESCELRSFGTLIGGGTPSRSHPAYWNDSISWASVKDFGDEHVFLYDTEEHISLEGLASSAANLVPENTPVICTRMAVGRCALTTRPTAINQDLKAFFLKTDVDRRFFIRLLRYNGPELDKISVGSTVRGITIGDLLSHKVLRPENSDEQTRIAYVLDTIDEAIAKTEAVIAKLKQARAGLLHDLLSYGLDENGRLRDPIAYPDQFKDSPLGRIPREWDLVKLGEALSMQAGNILSSESISEYGHYPVYGGNGIRGYTSSFTHEGLYALIGRQGALCGNIFLASGKFYATEHAVVVTPKEQMNVRWLASYLTNMNLNRFSESSAQPGLSVQKISHHWIRLPKFPEQEAIDLALQGIDKHLKSELDELQKYKFLKSGLQDDLLTGRVRVPESIMEGAAEA